LPLAAPVIDLGPVAAAVASAIEIAAAAAAAAGGGGGCDGGGGMAAAAALVMDRCCRCCYSSRHRYYRYCSRGYCCCCCCCSAAAAAAAAAAPAIAIAATSVAAAAAAALVAAPLPFPRSCSSVLLPHFSSHWVCVAALALKRTRLLMLFSATVTSARRSKHRSLTSYCRLREDDFATVKPNLAPQSSSNAFPSGDSKGISRSSE
jgi:hypothetical protein